MLCWTEVGSTFGHLEAWVEQPIQGEVPGGGTLSGRNGDWRGLWGDGEGPLICPKAESLGSVC